MLGKLRRIFNSSVVYSACVSLIFLPYYVSAEAQSATTDRMKGAARSAQEMQNSAISDLRGNINKLGLGAQQLVPNSLSSGTNKGMTVEQIRGFGQMQKEDEQYQKRGNTYISDLEKRSLNAGVDDPEAVAYSVLKKVSSFPKNQINENDPIITKTRETIAGLEEFSKTLADCSAVENYLLKEKVVHEPIYEHCTHVVDKTGTCQIQHLYEFMNPIEHAGGPYNIKACDGEENSCVNVWIGKIGDNYWSGNCSIYEEETQVRVVKPKSIKRVILEYTKWDDYMMVYAGKKGEEELIWTGPYDWKSDPNYFPPETSGKCELSTSWSLNPNIDITELFKNAEENSIINFKIRVSVSGEGEGYGRLRIEYDAGSVLDGDSWSPPECFELAKAVADGMAQGSVQCVEMPSNSNAEGTCVMVNGSQVCEDRFGQSPIKGISRLCRKVNVSANYNFYKGQMECYKAADGTTVCPQNNGGNLDDCQKLIDSGCTYIKSECTEGAEGESGNCYVFTNTYDCGYDQVISTPISDQSYQCEGSVACMGTDCISTDFSQSTDFAKAAALLHVAQQAAKDLSCTGTDKNGNVKGDEDVICSLFGGGKFECKKAVGGIQNCCDQPTSVNFVDYLVMTFAIYKADSAMMSLNAEKAPSFVGAYQELHTTVADVVSQGLSPVTKPLVSYAENISGTVKNFFEPVTQMIDTLKKEIASHIEKMVEKLLVKMGVQGGAGGAAAGAGAGQTGSMATDAAKEMASSVVGNLGTAVTVVGYVYMAYQVAMMVIQTIYRCEKSEFELASNRALRQCHYVGSYCKSKVLGTCIEKRYSYCCYKSPLGRILQEQIRTQLYGSQNFGTAKNPQCEGLSVEEFSKINWEAINLEEWVAMAQEAGFMGADIEKLSMEALTGKGSPQDYSGDRINVQGRAMERLDNTPIDDIRQGIEEKFVTPGEMNNVQINQ